MPGLSEPFHRVFSLPDGLVRVLGSIVRIFGSAMLDRSQYHMVGDVVAGELVGDNDPRGMYRKPLSRSQKNRLAALPFRRTESAHRARRRPGRRHATDNAGYR